MAQEKMGIPLLQTKFHIPSIQPERVPRQRLVERLNAGRLAGRKLSLISAPAGFGKTTLLSEWVAGVEQHKSRMGVAWLALDPGDDDPARFLTYFIAALQRVPGLGKAGVGEAALGLLRAAQPQPPPVEALLTTLINEIATANNPFVLVLDDYHLIQAPPIHEALTFLLDHLPPPMHLAIATRADPPLPLARLRGRGQLTELRQRDLRFTAQEAATFLNQVMGLDLSTTDVAALESRTEGWIVGLQLAALSLQGRGDAQAFIRAFSGGHHYVLEYLIEEVVRRQPQPVQRFLMQTSILERLCGPLCDALTGASDGAAMLAHLRQRNLFILPLDDEHRWYRYHHLFADLLGNLLRKEWPPEHIRELHLRASDWYEQAGAAAEAVNHALAAPDLEQAAALMARHSLAMMTRGELATLLRWIEALPDALAHRQPWLCIHQAWPLLFAGQTHAVPPLLRQVEEQVPLDDAGPEDQALHGHVAAIGAMLAVMRGDMAQALAKVQQGERLLPAENLLPRNVIAYARASIYYARGELEQASQALTQEVAIGRAADNLWTIVRPLCDLADLHVIQGQLEKARELVQEALQEAEVRGARQFGTVGYVLVKLGELWHLRNDLARAKELVSEGIQLMQQWQQPYELARGYVALAAVLEAQNDAPGAREALQKAQAIQSQHPDYHKLNRMVNIWRVRLCLAHSGPEEAMRQALALRLGETHDLIFREQEHILLAQVRVAQQRWEKALPLLAPLAQEAKSGGRLGHLIEILALQAMALTLKGDTASALAALEQALRLGEPEGYVRVLAAQDTTMAKLLQQAAAQGVAPDDVHRLLDSLGVEEQPSPPAAAVLVEPLTEREFEVLQLLGAGYSNQEIAETLVITLNTVKKHTSGIYGKLGVHSRTQAVVRAQELGIL